MRFPARDAARTGRHRLGLCVLIALICQFALAGCRTIDDDAYWGDHYPYWGSHRHHDHKRAHTPPPARYRPVVPTYRPHVPPPLPAQPSNYLPSPPKRHHWHRERSGTGEHGHRGHRHHGGRDRHRRAR